MRDDQFKCAKCGEIFDAEVTEEEAKKEYEEKFGYLPQILKGDFACVCDDCFKKLTQGEVEYACRIFREFFELIAETLLR